MNVRQVLIFFRLTTALLLAGLSLHLQESRAVGQDAKSDRPESASDIRDQARLFEPEVVKTLKERLQRVERETGVATLIETVQSTGDDPISVVLLRNVRRWGKDGLYLLIDKSNHKFEMIASGRLRDLGVIARDRRDAIRDAIVNAFKQGHFDEGLKNGVSSIEAALTDAKEKGKLPLGSAGGREREDREGSGLVVRQQVGLTLAGARLIIKGAEARAAEMGWKMNIAVVDNGGHLLSFARMDGARPASAYTSITKATTAATMRQETGPLTKGTAPPDPLLNLSLQNAASASGGKITTLYGGVPVLVDGQVIGAVGVGGGTGEQDAVVAKAGVARFLAELSPSPTSDSRPRENDEKHEPSREPRKP